MNTYRDTIVKNLKNGLKELTFVKKVFEWTTRALSRSDYPAIAIKDTKDAIDDGNVHSVNHELEFEIDVLHSGANAVDEVRGFMQEILFKLKELNDAGKIGENIDISGADIDVEQSDNTYALGTIKFKSLYYTTRFEI